MGNSSTDWQVQATLDFLNSLKLNDNPLLATPHCTTEDDVYEGYHIPKGSTVIFNSWYERHLHHNYVKERLIVVDIGRWLMMKMNIPTHVLSNQKDLSRTDN